MWSEIIALPALEGDSQLNKNNYLSPSLSAGKGYIVSVCGKICLPEGSPLGMFALPIFETPGKRALSVIVAFNQCLHS